MNLPSPPPYKTPNIVIMWKLQLKSEHGTNNTKNFKDYQHGPIPTSRG